MSVKFANNAFGTLNAGINNSATSITLSSGQGARFPTLASGEYFYATLIDTSNNLEVVKCTARSTDVLTVTRAQESTTAQAFAIGDRIELRVTAAGLTDAANPYDKDTSSTGSFALPFGTTAQQPTAADSEGHIRYDTDDSVVYYSNGTDWLKVSSVIPILTSATGNIFDGTASTLTLAGTGFLASNLIVNFFQSSDSIDEDVTVTPTSDTAATVTIPAAVYNNVTAGNLVSITVTNSDNITSAAVTKTAVALPSGGTVTTSGAYRIHTFTSSGTFTNTISSLSTEYLIVAGGGGGGAQTGGGGGAGGLRTGSSTISTASYPVVVGAGGNKAGPGSNPAGGSSGATSSFNSISSVGGGGGGSYQGNTINSDSTGKSGGSGGGGAALDAVQGPGGSGTSGQGNSGGNGLAGQSNGNQYYGGGGGGASQAGSNSTTTAGTGVGGNGTSSSITGSAVTYAGGGGGCTQSSATISVGGSGGGGNGSNDSQAAQNGGTNLGGGGGGARDFGTTGGGAGNGGSGIVIIRYQL